MERMTKRMMTTARAAGHLDRTADRVVAQYRASRRRQGKLDAALIAVDVARSRLAANDGTVAHPGARLLAGWLAGAARAGELDGFEERVREFIRPEASRAPGGAA